MSDDAGAVDRLRREAELATHQLIESWEEINLLYSISEILGRTVKLDDAAATILHEICETVGAGLGAIYVHDDERGGLVPVATLGVEGELPGVGVGDERSIVAQVFRDRHPLIAGEAHAGAKREAAVRRGAMLAVPVLWTTPEGGVPLGVVVLSAPRSRALFTAGDQKLVAAIASQIGTAIQIDTLVKASMAQERLAHEMQMAHDLQMRLLPAPSSLLPDAECAARVEPAQHVGGDFYQLFRLGQGRVGVLIGDVSSHGYQAALIMALTMSAMAIHAQAYADPGDALAALRNSLADELRETEMFLSICYVVVDPAHGTLRYANAGHPHAFVVRVDGTVERLVATDAPLGLGTQAPAVAQVGWSRRDDLLVLFTDGISDARDDAGKVLGEARVLDVVRARRGDLPSRVVDGVFALLEGHMGGGAPADDQAIVVLRS